MSIGIGFTRFHYSQSMKTTDAHQTPLRSALKGNRSNMDRNHAIETSVDLRRLSDM